jgi:hypothetical protein
MKAALAVALIGALVTPSPAPAQADVSWSKVRELPAGSRMRLIRPGANSHVAYFFFADDNGLRALNVSGVEPFAAKVLIRIASEQPDQLMRVTPGTSVLVDKDLVLTAEGLFAGSRKLADYDKLFESASRRDIETGVVRLEDVFVAHKMRRATKVMIALLVAAPFMVLPIACAVQGCD